jgi:hypothetical protein
MVVWWLIKGDGTEGARDYGGLARTGSTDLHTKHNRSFFIFSKLFLILSTFSLSLARTHENRRGGRRRPTVAPPRRKTLTTQKLNFLSQKNVLNPSEFESKLKNPKSLTKMAGSEWKVRNFCFFFFVSRFGFFFLLSLFLFPIYKVVVFFGCCKKKEGL